MTVEQMAEFARRRGHAYQVMTDHTQSLAIARGLTPEQVEEERALIRSPERALRGGGGGRHGAARDERRRASGCSTAARWRSAPTASSTTRTSSSRRSTSSSRRSTSRRRQPRAELTQRVLNAIENPHVDVIAHPSGRMIGTRDDLDLDWDTVYRAAARTGTVLEMNGSPHRLDLSVERARRALGRGCLLSIDSDAHHTREFSYLGWGISQARRAWVEPRNVLNTRSRADLLAWLATPKPRRMSPTLADPPSVRGESGARDLAIAVGVVVALSRFAPDPFVWPIAVVLLAAVFLGGLQVVAEADPAAQGAGVPVESLILPAAAVGRGARRDPPRPDRRRARARRSSSPGGLVGLAVVTELRLARASGPPSSTDRTAILIQIMIVGFLAFSGVAALVPGGLPTPGQAGGGLGPDALAVIGQAGADAVIAFLLGYRAAALRTSNLRDVTWFGLTGAAVVAIAAVALRSIEIPRILGPGAARPRVLPVGRDPQRRAGPAARPVARVGDRAARRARDRRHRLERRHPRLMRPDAAYLRAATCPAPRPIM